MTDTTISTSISGGITLTTLDTTITSAGTVNGSGVSNIVNGPSGTAWTLINLGVVGPGDHGANGVSLASGGTVTNASTGNITANSCGIYISGSAGSVTNAGSISGYGGEGIRLDAGGTVNNTGSIYGGTGGVIAVGTAAVSNAGTISGVAFGIYFIGAGSVTNAASGVISAAYGVFSSGASATLVNAGTITGSTYAVKLQGSTSNRVVVDPGAVFNGTVFAIQWHGFR